MIVSFMHHVAKLEMLDDAIVIAINASALVFIQ